MKASNKLKSLGFELDLTQTYKDLFNETRSELLESNRKLNDIKRSRFTLLIIIAVLAILLLLTLNHALAYLTAAILMVTVLFIQKRFLTKNELVLDYAEQCKYCQNTATFEAFLTGSMKDKLLGTNTGDGGCLSSFDFICPICFAKTKPEHARHIHYKNDLLMNSYQRDE